MKTKLVALVGMLSLSLTASVTLAQDDPIQLKYANSQFGLVQTGTIKELIDCPLGTDYLAKNVNPFLSGGSSGGGDWSETFLVDGGEVTLYVEWIENNSFRFEVQNGIMEEIAVTIDNEKALYKYESPVVSDGTPLGEGWLNVLLSGLDSAKVNHVDACLSLLDTDPPSITFNSPPTPAEGASVSGLVTIEVTVSDPSGVDPESVDIRIGGDTFDMDCVPETPGATEYVCSYEWDTTVEVAGSYTLEVLAFDLAEPTRNLKIEPIEFDVNMYTECFGTLGDDGDLDPDNPSEPIYSGGCMPTIEMRAQVPPDTETCEKGSSTTCFITGTVLKPDPARVAALYDGGNGTCPAGAPGYCGEGFPDCRMAINPVTGEWYPKEKVDLPIFDASDPNGVGLAGDPIDPSSMYSRVLAAVQAAYPVGFAPPVDLKNAIKFDQDTYGANGCIALTQHFKGWYDGANGGTELNVLYPTWPDDPATGLFFLKSHFPKNLLPETQVASCYVDDLQITAGAGYQALFQSPDDSGYFNVRTMGCKNPLLKSSRNNGFDGSNIITTTAGANYVSTATDPVEALKFAYRVNRDDFARLFKLIEIIDRDSLVTSGNFNRDVQSPINQAKRRFDNFNPKSLQQSIDSLQDAVEGIKAKTTYLVTEANPPGELLSVTYHLIWELGLLREELIRVEALQ